MKVETTTWAQMKGELVTWKSWPWWRKCLFAGGLAFLAAVFLFLGYFVAYEPVKFAILTARVENAQTAAQEREAFRMAHEWGRVFELGVFEGTNALYNSREWNAAVRDPNRSLQVEIEWLESNFFSGRPFTAKRTLTEKTNLYTLFDGSGKR